MAEEQLERLPAPIGLDLGGATPAETALSIFAEIIAGRNRRAGARLSAATGPIHGDISNDRARPTVRLGSAAGERTLIGVADARP